MTGLLKICYVCDTLISETTDMGVCESCASPVCYKCVGSMFRIGSLYGTYCYYCDKGSIPLEQIVLLLGRYAREYGTMDDDDDDDDDIAMLQAGLTALIQREKLTMTKELVMAVTMPNRDDRATDECSIIASGVAMMMTDDESIRRFFNEEFRSSNTSEEECFECKESLSVCRSCASEWIQEAEPTETSFNDYKLLVSLYDDFIGRYLKRLSEILCGASRCIDSLCIDELRRCMFDCWILTEMRIMTSNYVDWLTSQEDDRHVAKRLAIFTRRSESFKRCLLPLFGTDARLDAVTLPPSMDTAKDASIVLSELYDNLSSPYQPHVVDVRNAYMFKKGDGFRCSVCNVTACSGKYVCDQCRCWTCRRCTRVKILADAAVCHDCQYPMIASNIFQSDRHFVTTNPLYVFNRSVGIPNGHIQTVIEADVAIVDGYRKQSNDKRHQTIVMWRYVDAVRRMVKAMTAYTEERASKQSVVVLEDIVVPDKNAERVQHIRAGRKLTVGARTSRSQLLAYDMMVELKFLSMKFVKRVLSTFDPNVHVRPRKMLQKKWSMFVHGRQMRRLMQMGRTVDPGFNKQLHDLKSEFEQWMGMR